MLSPVFTELTSDQQHYVQVSYVACCPHRKENVQIADESYFIPLNNALILLHRFLLNSPALSKQPRTSPAPNFIQSDEKCTKWARSFIYPLTHSMVLVLPIFKTRTIIQRHYVEISYTKFHPYRCRNSENSVKVHLRPVYSMAVTALISTTYVFTVTLCIKSDIRNPTKIRQNV